MSQHLLETTLDSQSLFKGNFIELQCDTVRLPDGKTAIREYIRHRGAVAVLALTDDGQLVLERQYRHPVGRIFVEIPAGKLDPHETELDCAKRELLEETGYQADRWTHLGEAHPCIGYANERIVYFLAEGLRAGTAQLDDGEFVETFLAPLDQVLEDAANGTISDSKTLVGLFWLDRYLRSR